MTLAEEIARLTIGSPGPPVETRGISAVPPPPDNRRFHELVQAAREKILGGPMADRFWTGVPGMAEFEGIPSIRGPRWFDSDYLAQQGLMMLSPIAYHGSGAKFKKFDYSKIGTGEGNQAYGYGLYAAEEPKVAAEYYKNLIGSEFNKMTPEGTAARILYGYGGDKQAAIKLAERPQGITGATKEFSQEVARVLREGKYPGDIYKVNIPDDVASRMLDWDAPLSEQPPNVQKFADDWWKQYTDMYKRAGQRPPTRKPETGKDLYRALGPTDAEVSRIMNEAGIPGAKYKDQFTRNSPLGQIHKKGGATSNYVLFSDEHLSILGEEPAAGVGPQYYRNIMMRQRAQEGLEAAVRDPVTGKVYSSAMHRDVPWTADSQEVTERLMEIVRRDANAKPGEIVENIGFVNDRGKFMSRLEADRAFNPQAPPQMYRDIVSKARAEEGLTPAVKDPVTGKVYSSWSHGTIPEAAGKPGSDLYNRIMGIVKEDAALPAGEAYPNIGFIDSRGRFITRHEADEKFGVFFREDMWKKGMTPPAPPPWAGPKIDQRMFEEMDALIDEGINVEHPQIADIIERYTNRNEKNALTKAMKDPGYDAYANDLRLLLRRIYPDGKIPVVRKTGYAGGTGEGAGKFVSVSTNPGWTGDKYLVSVDDVAFAGHQAEGELIVKKTALKKGK